jgi:putative membrane protein
MGGMMGGIGFGFGYGLIGLLFSVAIIVGVVLLVVWAVRQFSSNGQNSSTPRQSDGGAQPSPREIVEKRYARGELTREQYQEMLSDLS